MAGEAGDSDRDEDQFMIQALEAVASAGASRQVMAATLAAAVRLRRERHREERGGSLVQPKELRIVEAALCAQRAAGLRLG